ncbi:ligand-gated channel [Sphingobium sp. TA15]|uniref:TonB-dependent receptor-like protein n=2 Tax=Sphingobium indicum TaxID=332055 RepID=D4Z2B3_SPHIU|nr:TonB-dependent receptor-like protein [Sphingobium indicum UT26S]BDD66180.1 ligand-gated channel [Sphingobium sp. TA15]
MVLQSSRLIVLAGALLASPAAAAEERAEEDIIVTGQRFEEQQKYIADKVVTATKSNTPSKDTPVSVTAITRAVLDDQFALTLGDALRNVAGSSPMPGFGGINTVPRIRGFQANSNLRDGFRQAPFYSGLDMATVGQIEVLKGAASALYGRFEAGGAVNIVSKKPTEQPYYAFDASAGSDDFYRSAIDIGGPIVADQLLFRFNGVYQNSGSYRDFVDTEKFVIAPSLEWRPTAGTSLLLEAEYLHRNGGFDRGWLVPSNFPTAVQNAAAGRLLMTLPVSRNLGEPTDSARIRQLRLDAILTQDLGNSWSLRAGIFYSRVRLTDNFFTSGTPLFPSPNVYNRRMLYANDNPDDINGSIEVSGALTTGAIGHKLLFGIDGSVEDYNYIAHRVPINSPIDPFAPVYGKGIYGPDLVLAFGGTNRYRALGLYAQDELALGDLRLLLGGRFDTTQGKRISTPGAPAEKRTTNAFSPRVGASWLVTPQVSLYASYAKSFLTVISGTLPDGRLPDPSHGENIEGGIKAELFGGRVTATAAIYQLTKTNVVVSDPANPGFSTQTGEQRSRGVELEANASLAEGLNLIGSYAHADSKITEDTNAALIGNRIYNAPRDTASLWISQRFGNGALAGLELGGGVFHVGNRAINNANLFDLPAYTRFDARIGYDLGPWRLGLNVNNIADKKYFESGSSVIIPGAPRQFFVSLGWRGGARAR